MATVGATAEAAATDPGFPSGAGRVRGPAAFRTALALVTAITVGLAALEIVLLLTHHEAVPGVLVLFPIVGLIYLWAGVVAWSRRPSNRFGVLLIWGGWPGWRQGS